MPIRSTPLVLAAAGFALAACTQTAGGSGEAPQASLSTPPSLPDDYKARVALHLAAAYAVDATGPAEIETAPMSTSGPLGATTSITVRYPVRTHSEGRRMFMGPGLANMMEKDADGIRCISVQAIRSIGTFGETQYRSTRPRIDPLRCAPGKAFERYAELERLGSKIRACRDSGERRCAVSLADLQEPANAAAARRR